MFKMAPHYLMLCKSPAKQYLLQKTANGRLLSPVKVASKHST